MIALLIILKIFIYWAFSHGQSFICMTHIHELGFKLARYKKLEFQITSTELLFSSFLLIFLIF